MRITFPEVVAQTYEITDQTWEIIKENLMGIAKYSFTSSYSTQVQIVNDKIWTYYTD
jgi:hypothetical protein